MKIKKHRIIIAVVGFFILLVGIVCFFVFTTQGSAFITRALLKRYLKSEKFSVGRIEGALYKKLVLHAIVVRDFEGIPQESLLKIQRFEASLFSFTPQGIMLTIHNGRLKMPGSEIIQFWGKYEEGSLAFSVYSPRTNLRETFDLFLDQAELKKVSGEIKEIEIAVSGSFSEPHLEGKWLIAELTHKGFSLNNVPVHFRIRLKDMYRELKLYGEVLLKEGILSGPRTARIALQPSKIVFEGVPQEPFFNLKGSSKVEGVNITIVFTGTPGVPHLRLSSTPSLPQEKLLLMLATNRSWKGAEASFSKGEVSLDLAEDFIDYFVFSGSGSKLAQKLGLSELSITYDEATQGVSVKKEVTEQMTTSYGIEQSQDSGGEGAIRHKVKGEYEITDTISLQAQKELKQEPQEYEDSEKEKTDDRILLKYKKEF